LGVGHHSGGTGRRLDVDLNGKQLTTPLKSWEDLGAQSFVGPAIYHKQFTAPTAPAGKKVYLEIADARDYVRVR